jgi:hypothetical protein
MNQYGSGIVYNGEVVLTKVSFPATNRGTLATSTVPVVRVTSATCVTGTTCPATVNQRNCPNVAAKPPQDRGRAGIACLEEGRKLYGTFGADLEPTMEPKSASSPSKQEVQFNLLFAIAPWSTSFIIDQTQLQLGPNPKALASFSMISMSPITLATSLPNNAKPWNAHVQLCFTVGKYLSKPDCRGALFDTGATSIDFQGSPATIPTSAAHCNYTVQGLRFQMYLPGSGGTYTRLASLATGYVENWTAVGFEKQKKGKKPEINTGLTFFNRNEIFYDALKGRVGLSPLASPGKIGRVTCNTGAEDVP